jgi:hypothetical protein
MERWNLTALSQVSNTIVSMRRNAPHSDGKMPYSAIRVPWRPTNQKTVVYGFDS